MSRVRRAGTCHHATHCTTISNSIVNGVPVAACRGLIDSVRADAANRRTTWRTAAIWKSGFLCESAIRDHTVHLQEPEAPGGTNTAPNMVESVQVAYGSCLTVSYTHSAALRGITKRNLDLDGFFGLTDEVAPGFSGFRVTVRLDADVDPQDLQAPQDHVLKTSPAGNMLTTPLAVDTEPRIPALASGSS